MTYVTVIGPTPPGTAVTSTRSWSIILVSPMSLPSCLLIPTSIMSAPSLISSSVMVSGRPTATTRMSAFFVRVWIFLLCEWRVVTLILALRARWISGLPTISERPMMTICLPARSLRCASTILMTACGVQAISESCFHEMSAPRFAVVRPSTSLWLLIRSRRVRVWDLRWSGSGICRRIASTSLSSFDCKIISRTLSKVLSVGSWWTEIVAPISFAIFSLWPT